MAQSIWLSDSFQLRNEVITRTKSELNQFADTVRAGKPVEFPRDEINELLEQKRALDLVPMTSVWLVVFRVFVPGFVVLGILVAIHFFSVDIAACRITQTCRNAPSATPSV